MESEISKYLGFAVKSGKIAYGVDNIKIRPGVQVILCSQDASQNLKDKLKTLGNNLNIKIHVLKIVKLDDMLNTVNCKAVGITDPHLAEQINLILEKEE